MAYNQVGGAAGQWFGPGVVYVMCYGNTEYKIGCTRRDPQERLDEIRGIERNPNIKLVGWARAEEMNRAETAAQNALMGRGLRKDPLRGGATDWLIGNMAPGEVLSVVQEAVRAHNLQPNAY